MSSEPLRPTCDSENDAKRRLEEVEFEMCGGASIDDYLAEFRAQGETQCTNVWSKGIIAYRCRTCQTNDSSAICVECFQNGNHWKHDYVMYHSESGGCCDCGDRAAWKESGFCSTHQRLNVPEMKVKDELMGCTHCAVRYVLEELLAWIKKLYEILSDNSTSSSTIISYDQEMAMALIYLNWSLKICSVDALRSIVCRDIVEHKILFQMNSYMSPLESLLECLGWMPDDIIVAETTLFLQLLYRNEFKIQFLNILKGKYEQMIILAVNDAAYRRNYRHLDTNLDRVMVQLFNDPEMTTRLVHDYDLLELFIGVFSKVISCSVRNELPAVDVDDDAIKCKVYLRPQGDLRLIVTHGDIAVHMLSKQHHLFPRILDVLVKLQWINPYNRNDDDIEFENSWTLAIQLEMNSMAIVFQLMSRCYQDPDVGKKTLVTAATYTLKALKEYLSQAKRITEQNEDSQLSRRDVSLHIPLHRTLSAILQKLVLLPWDNHERGFLSALLSRDNHDTDKFTEDEVLQLMEHPLRILVWMAQIRAQMWRRISEEFSRLELIYRGSFWHDQSMDMDILLLQFCTVALENMQETIFLKIAEQFDNDFKVMATSRLTPKGGRRQTQINLLQDFMRLILLIVRERRNLGKTDIDEAEDKVLQYDVIQWLCVRDQTYSQLCRALSAVPMENQKLNAMLEKVAIYHAPKVADRGFYQLKPEYWKDFDPLFAHYYLIELEDAEDRAVKVGKRNQYWRIKAPAPARAPYDRLSSLLHTKACHMFLLNVLDEVRFLVKENATATAGEALGVTALQMMAVLVSDSRVNMRNVDPEISSQKGIFDEYPTDNIAVNIGLPIRMKSSNAASNPISIHEVLVDLLGANDCARLVDSVNHVLELLCPSTNEKSGAPEVDSLSNEDIQRKLLKEQRQKAILETFAAKQNAFAAEFDVSDDDDDFNEGTQVELFNTADKSFPQSGKDSTSEKAVVSMADADCVAMETSTEAKECVLCKRKKDDNNSSTCWIALVQRYNFPRQVLDRGIKVANSSDVTSALQVDQSPEVRMNDGLDQLVTVGSLTVSENLTKSCTPIDLSTIEHVQCCGHQMHLDCYQGHMKNLQLTHPGYGVVDPVKSEFQCPTCRRLANVLLPDMEASLLTKRPDAHEGGKGIEAVTSWRRFWHSNKNLEHAVEFFCDQVVRVQTKSPQKDVILNKFEISQALWEGLVLNIMHCEVETRDGPGKSDSSASSSSAPVRLADESTWGGDPAHWRALRELGRLAMLSNTLPAAVQDRREKLRELRTLLGLGDEQESLTSASTSGIRELEEIILKIFPKSTNPCEEPSETTGAIEPSETTGATEPSETTRATEPSETTGATESSETTGATEPSETTRATEPSEMTGATEPSETTGATEPSETTRATEPSETTGATDMAIDEPITTSSHETEGMHEHQMESSPKILAGPMLVHRREKQEHQMETSPEILSGPISILRQEDNKRPKYADPEPHRGTHQAATAASFTVPASFPLQKHDPDHFFDAEDEHKPTYSPSHISSQDQNQEQNPDNSLDAPENRLDWIPNIMKNGVLTTDPLLLLALLLIIFTGQPDKRSLLSMVKFAYTAAVLQSKLAVTELDVKGPMVETLVQRACLPFLRRAAMLVQIVTQKSFGGQHGLSGTKVLDFNSLKLALQLPDCADILQPQDGPSPTLAIELLRLHYERAPGSFTFELRQVPQKALLHKLPEVFQELLLVNIHNKKLCSSCGEMPADPAICLICGELLCCDADCCRNELGIGECSQHAAKESAGVGIFLLLRSTQLLLLRDNRTCMGLSLYLDIHGEEDLYLRRSQLLYLSDLRLNEVRRLWMTAAFDYDSYILRNSQSRPNVY